MPNESNEQYEWGLKTAKQLLQEKGYGLNLLSISIAHR
jgi:hypothetical protein